MNGDGDGARPTESRASAHVEEIIRTIREQASQREQSVLSGKTYADEPLVFSGAELRERRSEAAGSSQRQGQEAHGVGVSRGAASPLNKAVAESAHKGSAGVQERLFKDEAYVRSGNGHSVQSARSTPVPSKRPASTRIEPAAAHAALPPVLREMRGLERTVGIDRFHEHEADLFVRQAKLAEDFEDDAAYQGIVPHHRRATYENLDDRELRGYFTWRTRWRAGNVKRVPNAYARILAAEIVNGIGVRDPELGLEALQRLRDRSAELDETGMGAKLSVMLDRWMSDYRIVFGLDASPLFDENERMFASAVSVLRSAEKCILDSGKAYPDSEALWNALQAVSNYPASKSPFLRDHEAQCSMVAGIVFERLVDYCALHSTASFVDGIVGRRTSRFWAPFVGLPYLARPFAQARIDITDAEYITCEQGRLRHHREYGDARPSKRLGQIVREMDRQMRLAWNFGKPLKQRPLAPQLVQMIAEAVASVRRQELEDAAEAEAERRKISIDLSKLSAIRSDSAETREALLVDEEVDGDDDEGANDRAPSANEAPEGSAAPSEKEGQKTAPASGPVPASGSAAQGDSLGLTELEGRVVRRVFSGKPVDDLFGPGAPMLSVVVDAINEKFFDEIGDSVVQMVDGKPCAIDDYAEDVRDLLDM